jgi:hypothetical protein
MEKAVMGATSVTCAAVADRMCGIVISAIKRAGKDGMRFHRKLKLPKLKLDRLLS